MKVDDLENKLKEIEHPKAPEKLCLDVLEYAEGRSELEVNEKQKVGRIPIIDKLLLTIIGSIPFIELFWIFNEVFIKKNKIKLHLK